jgi:hypothetical protein
MQQIMVYWCSSCYIRCNILDLLHVSTHVDSYAGEEKQHPLRKCKCLVCTRTYSLMVQIGTGSNSCTLCLVSLSVFVIVDLCPYHISVVWARGPLNSVARKSL